jgi:hypothetical protein
VSRASLFREAPGPEVRLTPVSAYRTQSLSALPFHPIAIPLWPDCQRPASLSEPTKPMVTEAAAGQLDLDGTAPVPRIQIVTITQALQLRDRTVRLPLRRDDAFRKAAREADKGAQSEIDH